MVKVEI